MRRVLGVPILNRPDLLSRMLGSIDISFERIVIIDNSIDRITDGIALPENSIVIAPQHNLGVSASWNLIVKATPLADWWCIANSDIAFAEGQLAQLATQIEGDRESLAMMGTFAAFGITPQVIEKLGWPDENFVPGYFDDNDLARRALLAGVKTVALAISLHHDVSSTIGSDDGLRVENARTFPVNMAYYQQKWGGPPGGERYLTPFDAGGDVRDWRLSINRLRNLTWKIR